MVMKRALILNAVRVTGMMKPCGDSVSSESATRTPDKKLRETMGQISSPMVLDLETAGLWPDVEEDEQKVLMFDRISTRQQIDASWLGESIVSLLWALQMIPELPAYDQEADPSIHGRLRSDSIPDIIKLARLRPKREIEKQRQIAELWHWRARTRRVQKADNGVVQLVGGRTIEQIIERAATMGARGGRLPNPIAGDFPAMGKPYHNLSSDQFATLASIAYERHKAFNWLCGYSPTGRWADTRTDT